MYPMAVLKSTLFYILPHHLISRFIFILTRVPAPLCYLPIKWFIKAFKVDMTEAEQENISDYKSFNRFFTRALKTNIRPIDDTENSLCSPVDGCFSQLGKIDAGTLVQAKKHTYSCADLLAGNDAVAQHYQNGSFATIYLSPRDYHRIHMPIDGQLISSTYVPGRLFSVAPDIVNNIPRLFARNERVICEFATQHGRLAVIMVGAINVAAIETIWHGLVTPPRKFGVRQLTRYDVSVNKGQEIARFNMGSTVILLSENPIDFSSDYQVNSKVKMGRLIGQYK